MTTTTTLPISIPPVPVPTQAVTDPATAYVAGLAPKSRKMMRYCIERLTALAGGDDPRTYPWHGLRHAHTAHLRTKLIEQKTKTGKPWSTATVNLHLAALRGILKEAKRLGLMTSDDYSNAVDIELVRGSKLPRGRALEGGELRELFKACKRDETAAGRRDAALIAVLYGAGIRRSEAAALTLADYNQATGELKILGKGNKERLCYATNGASNALESWLAVRGTEPGPLFLPVNKGGRIEHRPMTSNAIYNMLRKRGEEAGLSKALSPHDLRRSFVGDMLDAGADVSLVQRLAGHSDVSTTARYDRRPEHAKRKAAELLHVPFKA